MPYKYWALIEHSLVAISGLGGHPYGSFKNKSDNHMWLRDSLPSQLTDDQTGRPMARIMLYGYDSTVAGSKSFNNLAGLAQHFRESLGGIGITRSLIFVAHSLGGLIVKEVSSDTIPPTLARMLTRGHRQSSPWGNPVWKSIKSSFYRYMELSFSVFLIREWTSTLYSSWLMAVTILSWSCLLAM